ncbi:hypothetical protein ABZ543_12135 [Streptomyces roseifaciens]
MTVAPADLRWHIMGFAMMMENLHGHLLPRWRKAAEDSELAPLRNFAPTLGKRRHRENRPRLRRR